MYNITNGIFKQKKSGDTEQFDNDSIKSIEIILKTKFDTFYIPTESKLINSKNRRLIFNSNSVRELKDINEGYISYYNECVKNKYDCNYFDFELVLFKINLPDGISVISTSQEGASISVLICFYSGLIIGREKQILIVQ
ncbi:MAG: hypothetical protein M0D57_20945 [Sphingobacteriales bacterium JAD_PAG50586_3]|nr:MAG: hypothetical protein M0D57_20945 [Sphingobacteriales bacterium JAD_PAG50586_3]